MDALVGKSLDLYLHSHSEDEHSEDKDGHNEDEHSEDGRSEPFFVPSKGNTNGAIYRKECIERRLIPFLQQHYADVDYIFWPDLASSHYAKYTVALL